MNIILIIAICVGVLVIGGGIGLLFWYRTKPKQETWIAYVYGISEGIREISYDKHGKPTSKFRLKDLIPYKEDVLIKYNKEHGVTVYKLSSLGHTTQQPSPDAVELWGNNKRIIKVLLVGNNATILKQGYDVELGERIFRPMPRERLEMVISEAEIKTNDLEESKSLLQQALPWIGVGIMFISLVAVAYFNAQGMIETSRNFKDGAEFLGDTIGKVTEQFREDLKGLRGSLPQEIESNKYGKVSNNINNTIDTIK